MCVCVCVCVFADNVATLFRASTLATMLMDQLMKLTAMEYLHSVLKAPVQRIAEIKESCEVNVYTYMYMYIGLGYTCSYFGVL